MYQLKPIPANSTKIRIRFIRNCGPVELREGKSSGAVPIAEGEEMNGYVLTNKDVNNGVYFKTPWGSDLYINLDDAICVARFDQQVTS